MPRWLLCGVHRQSAIDALAELREYAPGRQWRLIQVAGTLEDVDRNKSHLLGELNTPVALGTLKLTGSVQDFDVCKGHLDIILRISHSPSKTTKGKQTWDHHRPSACYSLEHARLRCFFDQSCQAQSPGLPHNILCQGFTLPRVPHRSAAPGGHRHGPQHRSSPVAGSPGGGRAPRRGRAVQERRPSRPAGAWRGRAVRWLRPAPHRLPPPGGTHCPSESCPPSPAVRCACMNCSKFWTCALVSVQDLEEAVRSAGKLL